MKICPNTLHSDKRMGTILVVITGSISTYTSVKVGQCGAFL